MKQLLLFLLGIFCSLATQAQILTYDFTGDPGDQTSQPVASKASNVTATALIRTVGASALSSNTMSFSGLTAGFKFQVGPATGQSNLSSITLNYQRTLDGPTAVGVQGIYVNPEGIDYVITPVAGGSLTGTSGTITLPFHGRPYSGPLTTINLPTGYSVRLEFTLGGTTSSTATFALTNQLIVNEASPLPVTFESFTGRSTPSGINLNWTTSLERSNQGFDILKSQSVTGFEKIGFIAAKGSGNIQAQTTYTFTDTDVVAGQLYYYQLKQRDTDGQFALSQLVAVRVTSDLNTFSIYPNPNQGSFILTGQNLDPAKVKLYSSSGTEVPIRTVAQGSTGMSIATQSVLSQGIYYLKPQDSVEQRTPTLKVIVP
ncbi:T9SS type A sorting domain-containing protein [Spirosoma sp. HMF3257]|uniref:Secretion system C-terminal sorting domain-containing protein n=1 Tax=Spirosoma telluris TaxID=2183553 RepID=A0A327NGD5_9BACT|nr:T9SS type A sorting domain-containing protein [Spirosoma telluris]RAI74352.1 hypothetical protein HMF3257_08675 [Spirosoma telluris]